MKIYIFLFVEIDLFTFYLYWLYGMWHHGYWYEL